MAISTHCQPTLPAHLYYDPRHYARELEAIWYADWICVGREDEVPEPGDYRVIHIGDQQVLLTRDGEGTLQAFHNTCRHRGSQLCTTLVGRFRAQRIVCPYHAWTYSLQGDLIATPRRMASADFTAADYPLYRVAVQTWAGFVFVHLDAKPATSLRQSLGPDAAALSNWPLADLVSAHCETHTVACNWKIFWENFSECYHCPLVHPELCRIVPIYGRGLNSLEDDPTQESAAHDGANGGMLAPGAVTWSLDGQTQLPWFEGLTERERSAGMTFLTILPSMFLVAHVDYVRSVRVVPRGPEETLLLVDWLLHPQAAGTDFDLERVVELGRLVVSQDARVCELNQKGLRSRRHETGVLVPQEGAVAEFDRWVLTRLGDGPSASG